MTLIPRQHRIKLNVVRFSKYKISYKLTQVVHAVATSSVYFPKFICQTWPCMAVKKNEYLLHCIIFGGHLCKVLMNKSL